MIIPDMLKNAPMFKRIDPKYRVRAHASVTWLSLCFQILMQACLSHACCAFLSSLIKA